MVTHDRYRIAEVVVRSMTAADIDDALDMFAGVAEEGRWLGTEAGFGPASRRAAWTSGLDDPAHAAFVAVTADGSIVGVASSQLTGFGVVEIGMAVADSWRGCGLGGRLLDALVVAAIEKGAHKVALQVWPHNERAIALYVSRGFAVEGRLRRHYRRRNGEIWDAVLMGLVLDESSPGSPYDESGSATEQFTSVDSGWDG